MAIAQVVIVGVVYLVLYKYLLNTIGIELLGVWSLIIASTSLALIANFGISTSIIKFVATYHARSDIESLKKLLFTSSVFIILTYSFISIVLLFLGNSILPYFIEPKYLSIALEILPFSLISLIINALGGVISSSLDGIQKNYIKSYILSFTAVLLFLLSVLLTPNYGLKGLVFAQIAQGIVVLIASLFFLNNYLQGVVSLRWNWSKKLFKEIINYGLKMQALSIMQMSFEPITKGLLSKFGGLSMVGYYEMASRLVTQLRSLIVSANQVVIPVVADAKETNEGYVKELYIKSFSIVLFFDILLITGVIIFAPLVSYLWIGKLIPFFVFVVILNSVVVFINILSNPAYFSYLGEGKLNWLIYSYFAISILNPLLGFFLGSVYNGYGVVIAWNVSFLVSSIIILQSYHKLNSIALKTVLGKKDFVFICVASLLASFGCLSLYRYLLDYTVDFIFITIFALCFIVFVALLIKNKNFKTLLQHAKQIVVRK